MTSAVGRAARTDPGRKSLLPRMPLPITTSAARATAASTRIGQSGGQAERSDSAVLHARESDGLVHRGERRRPRAQAAPHDTVHIGTRRGQHHAGRVHHVAAALALDHDAVGRDVEAHTVACAELRGIGQSGIDRGHADPLRDVRLERGERTNHGHSEQFAVPECGLGGQGPGRVPLHDQEPIRRRRGAVSPPARSARQRRPRLRRTATASTAAPAAAAITTPGRSR